MSRQPALRIAGWTADPSTGQLTRGDHTVHLTPRVMDVLMMLASRPGEVISLDELLDAIWGDVHVTPESVYQAIAALRRALGDDTHHPEYIETVPKRGYRLTVLVEQVEVQHPAPDAAVAERLTIPAAGRRFWARSGIVGGILAAVGILVFHSIGQQEAGVTRQQRVAVVAADNEAGAVADGLVARLARTPGVRVVTADVPMYTGQEINGHLLMASSLGADLVLVLSSTEGDQFDLALIDPESGAESKGQLRSSAEGGPESIAGDLLRQLESQLVLSPVSQILEDTDGRSSYAAAELEVLGRYHLQRRFTFAEDPVAVLDRAIDAFRAAVETDPEYVSAWTGLALAHVFRAQYLADPVEHDAHITAGKTAVERALELSPAFAEAYAAIGLANIDERDLLLGRAALERALNLDPANPAVMRWLSKVLARLGEYRQAANYSAHAAELAPFSGEILETAASQNAIVGEFDIAIPLHDASVKLYPNDTGALNNKVVWLREQGRLDLAIAASHRLLASVAGETPSYHLRPTWVPGMVADLYIQIGLLTEAVHRVEYAERMSPEDLYTRWARASLLLASDRVDEARGFVANWPTLGMQDGELAIVAAHAVMAGMDDLARDILDRIRPESDLAPGSNQFLTRGRWLSLDFLQAGYLPGVYLTLLHTRAEQKAAANAVLSDAEQFLDYWISQSVYKPHALYCRAAVHGLRGQADEGTRALADAIDAGWRAAWRLRVDPILDGLRRHPRFDVIVASLDAELERQRAAVEGDHITIAEQSTSD